MMVIQESLGMKSILKYLLKNRILILSVIDIALIIWIIWYESRIQYEALPDCNYNMGKKYFHCIHKHMTQ